MPIISDGGSPGGGSPSPSTWARGIYDSSNANAPVAANVQAQLDFGVLIEDDAVLDLTDPTLPLILVDGVYAVTAIVNFQVAAHIDCQVRIELTFDPVSAAVDAVSFFQASAGKGFYGQVSNTYFIAAGAELSLTAIHFDDINHVFGTNVNIQRVA